MRLRVALGLWATALILLSNQARSEHGLNVAGGLGLIAGALLWEALRANVIGQKRMSQNCKTCRHWDPTDWSAKLDRGDCRRYAPHPFPNGLEAIVVAAARLIGNDRVFGDEAALDVTKTLWPNTCWLDWCSEWDQPANQK